MPLLATMRRLITSPDYRSQEIIDLRGQTALCQP